MKREMTNEERDYLKMICFIRAYSEFMGVLDDCLEYKDDVETKESVTAIEDAMLNYSDVTNEVCKKVIRDLSDEIVENLEEIKERWS